MYTHIYIYIYIHIYVYTQEEGFTFDGKANPVNVRDGQECMFITTKMFITTTTVVTIIIIIIIIIITIPVLEGTKGVPKNPGRK